MTRNNWTDLKLNRNKGILLISIVVEFSIIFSTFVTNIVNDMGYYAPAVTALFSMVASLYYYQRFDKFAYVVIDREQLVKDDELFKNNVITSFNNIGYKRDKYISKEYDDDIVMNGKNDKIVIHIYNKDKLVDIGSVQELVISMWHFEANKGYLITNDLLSDEVKNMACSCNVELWDKDRALSAMK